MSFDPETQSLICAYCSNKIDISSENNTINEYDFETAEQNAPTDWGNKKRIIKCESCGAETILDENSTAEFCAFCGSSHIIKQDDKSDITPESLIPFKISNDKAKLAFKTWIKSKFFAPKALKSTYTLNKISGVYIPHWTYDSNTHSAYRAEKGTYYYVTETKWVTENGERKQVTEEVRKTRWEWVSGSYAEFFDDILINASKQVNEKIIKKLEPFNLEELVSYKPDYLSGFLAERYSKNLKEGWNDAKIIIDREICSGVIRKINGDEVRSVHISTSYDDVKFKHILLPIWVSSYSYKDKIYHFMINGETGEVQGESPISPLKVTLLILFIAAIVLGVVYLYLNSKG
jgi:predicted RNA-binding Zn-ribbon protein involved in translation (DUF1610 family)